MARKPLNEGFPPIVSDDARWLVLGSMPGVASLEARKYYAHPRNAFWPIMGELFGFPPDRPYEERRARLTASRVAVWDVLRACRREGSLDSAIETQSEVANDFAAFFHRRQDIRWLFFNGQKAEAAFRRRVAATLDDATIGAIACRRLPSTSPAHAGRTFAQKLDAWRTAFREAGASV